MLQIEQFPYFYEQICWNGDWSYTCLQQFMYEILYVSHQLQPWWTVGNFVVVSSKFNVYRICTLSNRFFPKNKIQNNNYYYNVNNSIL
jgi:hypothetical protein